MAQRQYCQWSFDYEPSPGARTPPPPPPPELHRKPGGWPWEAGQAGTLHWKAGSFVLNSCPLATPQSYGPSTRRVRKWQAGCMEAWACCLPGLWEGSQWFAKNRPRSRVCLPAGSRVPPWYEPRCLPALLCFLQLALPTGAGLGAAASWVFGWDLGKEKA